MALSQPMPASAVEPDVSEPQLVAFEVAPLSIDVSATSAVVSVRARITDDQAGAETPTMVLSSETTDQSAGFGSMRRTSGTALDGWYEWSATVPQGAAPGTWDVVLYPLRDLRGNAGDFGPPSHFPNEVNVVNPSGSDTAPPQLVEFSVSPAIIDVTESAQTVHARARVTDDQSGALPPTMTLSSQDTDQTAGFGSMQRVSGTSLDGWYEWTATVPQGAAAGTWEATMHPLRDGRGNAGSFGPPASFANDVTVINGGASDVTPPRLVELEVTPATIDVADAGATVSVRARITDDRSGALAPTMTLSSEDTDQSAGFGAMQRVSGTALDGWYEWSAFVPQGAAPGPWELVLYPLRDANGNSGWFGPPAGFPNVVNVVNFSGDETAPRLESISVSPQQYYAGETDATLTVRARITDAASGAVAPVARLQSDPSQPAGLVYEQQLVLVSGSANDGIYEWTGPVDVESVAGAWVAAIPSIRDVRGNTATPSATATFEVLTGDRPQAPSAPRAVTALPGNGSASVNWQAPASDNGAAISSYVVTATPSGRTATVSGTSTSATVTGLTNGTAYRFTVVAVNAAGSSPASAASTAVTPRTVASAPTAVAATPGNTSAAVTWAVPSSNGGASISSYVVTASPGGRTATVSGSTTSATVTGLTNGTAYTFTVVAVNAAGTSPASTASAAVTPRTVPSAPSAVTATPGVSSAEVRWSAPSSNGGSTITSYVVTASPGGRTATVPGSATTATVTGLTNGTGYTFTVVAVNAAGSSPASTASAAVTPFDALVRVAGSSRWETAAAIAERFAPGVETVYIASGTNFPDALAGAALASQGDAPVLLSQRDTLPTATARALERLQPQRIVLLGGEPTLSRALAADLDAYGNVSRIAGADRYATAAEISRGFGIDVGTVYIASGLNFPDALAGASLAGATGSPVLLTNPTSLPSSVSQALGRLNPDRIVVLGGTPSVSASVMSSLHGYAPTSRIAGSNRYETASLIAAQFPEADRVYVASGAKFPDALAGAALAGAQGAPVLLSQQATLPGATQQAIERLQPDQVIVLGDHNSIDDAVAQQLRALVQ